MSPFSNEKTPSFTVNDEKGFYHCFSSGEHGNIFDFLMKTQSLKFGEAVRQLASQAGMQPYKFTSFDLEKEKRYQTYKNILKDYSDHHHKLIFKNNSSAMDYLKKRGITREAITEFQIGFVPDNSDYYNHLSKKFNEKEILQTGLFYKNEKYNKFVNRFHKEINPKEHKIFDELTEYAINYFSLLFINSIVSLSPKKLIKNPILGPFASPNTTS